MNPPSGGKTIRAVSHDAFDEADRAYFEDAGCLLLKQVYSAEAIEAALNAVLAALPRERHTADIWAYSNSLGSIGTGFSRSAAEWALYQDSDLLEIVRRIKTWSTARWHEVTGTLSVSWPNQTDGTWLHLDYAGESLDDGEALVYGMIYLTDVDHTGARTKVVPGSHRVVRDFLVRHPDDPRVPEMHSEVGFLDLDPVVPVDVEAGDVLLFDYLLVHSGGGQANDEVRPVLRVGYTNAAGALGEKLAEVPDHIRLNPTGEELSAPI